MIDLTKIDLPLHELDDETAAALFLAWRAGKPVEILATNGNWAFWASGHLCLGATYRLRPGPLELTVQRVAGETPHSLKRAAEARVAELEAALRPFAEYFECWPDEWPDDADNLGLVAAGADHLTKGQFRTAHDVLTETVPETSPKEPTE